MNAIQLEAMFLKDIPNGVSVPRESLVVVDLPFSLHSTAAAMRIQEHDWGSVPSFFSTQILTPELQPERLAWNSKPQTAP
jgi:hypothetical protein